MKQSELDDIVLEAAQRRSDLARRKGSEYTRGNEDVLVHFKRAAEKAGVTPLQAWLIFFGKHADAIASYCRTGSVASEPIESRIDDAQVYLDLLRGLVAEVDRGDARWGDGTPVPRTRAEVSR